MKTIILFLFSLFIVGCAVKHPIKSQSATILIKTPNMKFYDKGFITKYDDFIDLEIFNVGNLVLKLKIYKDKVCEGTFRCISSKEFNNQYFHHSYNDDFLYDLFSKKNIKFKDKINNILIKVK